MFALFNYNVVWNDEIFIFYFVLLYPISYDNFESLVFNILDILLEKCKKVHVTPISLL